MEKPHAGGSVEGGGGGGGGGGEGEGVLPVTWWGKIVSWCGNNHLHGRETAATPPPLHPGPLASIVKGSIQNYGLETAS